MLFKHSERKRTTELSIFRFIAYSYSLVILKSPFSIFSSDEDTNLWDHLIDQILTCRHKTHKGLEVPRIIIRKKGKGAITPFFIFIVSAASLTFENILHYNVHKCK